MNLKRHWILCALALVLAHVGFTQNLKEFSNEPDKFVSELADLFSGTKNKDDKQLIEKEFGPLFLEQTAAGRQQIIIETANGLLKAKLRVSPGFRLFVQTILVFNEKATPEDKQSEWYAFINQIVANKKQKKNLGKVLESTSALFRDKSFFKNNSITWSVNEPNYTYSFDKKPLIVFENVNLLGLANKDSLSIKKTSGVFDPVASTWVGGAGVLDWSRVGLPSESTYATFDKYKLKLKTPQIKIDSAIFHNEFFEQPLDGKIIDKALNVANREDASYPQFDSYDLRLEINNIIDNVNYEGGFSMRGRKLAGSGTQEEPAILTFYRDKKPFLVSKSLRYVIRPDRINSNATSVSVYLEEDSIYHSNVVFKLDREKKELELVRTEDGTSQAPFYNSYHNVDMNFETFSWKLDDPIVRMGAIKGSSTRRAFFESKDYYSEGRYDAMIGLGTTHPLVEIRDFVRSSGLESFYAKDLSYHMRLSEEQVDFMLIDLNNQGFVDYDLISHYCTVKPKMTSYILASAGKKDYDVIAFASDVPTGSNCQLNLLNYNLLLKGVQQFQLSDSQEVDIFPAEKKVLLKRNRDFSFGGRINAGDFEFMGSDYYFHYDDFKIDLNQVDSVRIYVEDEEATPDKYGNYPKRRVKNVIEDIKGSLRIDEPTNKSGVLSEKYPHYPVFKCVKETYVYYDSENIQEGVYNRDKVYYQLKPFEIDSLDNFTRGDLGFDGVFVSGGIFPDIEEPLTLMEDLSLGFNRSTGAGGLPIYGGKGQFTADLTLNYSGLQGEGALEYLTSTSNSESFVFFPDSTKGVTTSFVNLEQRNKIEVPKASALATDLSFYPYEDMLTVSSIKQDSISFFNEEADLSGTLYLEPIGMSGSGAMDLRGATLTSNLFTYDARKILADTSDFVLNAVDMTSLAFKTTDVNAEVDFDLREGLFKSNGDETKVEFPENQYICFMDQFRWFMNSDELALESNRKVSDDFVIDTSEEGARSNFFSTNQYQDSLNFLAPRAIFDLKKSTISATKIEYISVADCKITPDSGKVVIRKRAKMDPLENATIIANYVTQYYRIFGANLEIRGRQEYEGEGDYIYKDENEDEQIVHLTTIKVDTSLQTIGSGKIEKEMDFYLSPYFAYFGDFELFANQKNLTFDGGARPMHNCEVLDRNYVKFRSEIDPKDIYIPVDSNMASMGAERLGAGVYLHDEAPMEIYGSFMSRVKGRKDGRLVAAQGFLYYDKAKNMYLVGDKEKIKQPKLPGDLVTLDLAKCEIKAEGRVDLQSELQSIKMSPIGKVLYNSNNSAITFRGAMGIDMFFDETALKTITDQLVQWPDLNPIDIQNTYYEYSIQELLGLEKADKVISELSLTGQLKKIPEQMSQSFYLADVTLKWDDAENAWISEGRLGIASVNKKNVFRYVKGKIEITKSRSFDSMKMYIELDPANWFYFEYKSGLLNFSSSDKGMVAALQELKDDKKKFKDEDGNKMNFMSSISRKNRDRFISQFPEFD